MIELRLVIPLIPPSANHYRNYRIVIPKSGGKPFVQWYVTAEAEAFFAAVAVIAQGRFVAGESLDVSYIVFLGAGRRTDTDNFAKVILDSLKHAKVIRDDLDIDDLHCHRRKDVNEPRTVIIIRSNQGVLEI